MGQFLPHLLIDPSHMSGNNLERDVKLDWEKYFNLQKNLWHFICRQFYKWPFIMSFEGIQFLQKIFSGQAII